jgi:hypothetical protein
MGLKFPAVSIHPKAARVLVTIDHSLSDHAPLRSDKGETAEGPGGSRRKVWHEDISPIELKPCDQSFSIRYCSAAYCTKMLTS